MAFALNILALLIVLGLCWVAMMWLSGNFHGNGGPPTVEADGIGDLSAVLHADEPCGSCEGVGARSAAGRITPCHDCYGTGVLQ